MRNYSFFINEGVNNSIDIPCEQSGTGQLVAVRNGVQENVGASFAVSNGTASVVIPSSFRTSGVEKYQLLVDGVAVVEGRIWIKSKSDSQDKYSGPLAASVKPRQLANFKGALGLARGGIGQCKILVVGDSIAAGTVASTADKSWPSQFGKLLDGSSADVVYMQNDAWGTTITSDPRITSTGSPNQPGVNTHWVSLTDTITYTSQNAGTVVEFMWVPQNGASFTVTVDGVNKGSFSAGSGYPISTITGLSNTTHTVVFTKTAGNPVLGTVCVRPANGVVVHNVSLGGGQTTQFLDSGDYWSAGYTTSLVDADLAIIALGTNDKFVSRPVAEYISNIKKIITTCRTKGADVVLINGYNNPSATFPMGSEYHNALLELAETEDLAMIDWYEQWGVDWFSSKWGTKLTSDGVHVNNSGSNMLARAVAKALD